MAEDWENDADWQKWADHVINDVVPKMDESALAVAIVPRLPETDSDIKWCVELGMMIMLDKPIIAVVAPGTKVPSKLVLVADEIVEADMKDADFQDRMMAAIGRVTARLDGG